MNLNTSSANDSLEVWLNKATNPLDKEENWEAIVGFCDQINRELEGPQIAIRLLVHKIQSPQEKESLFALTTLEACVKNCSKRFQQEVGKFRFINEMIKVISPKYLGNHTSEKVKTRCIEMLYAWCQTLSQEAKIKEAYQMLKRQHIIKQDPVVAPEKIEEIPPPPPPHVNSIFDDDEKSKTLSRLLRSKNPDDLQAANRLIKNMVKQDAERTEKVTRRAHQLETVSNNVKLLSEMLQNHQPSNSSESDLEIMKELAENIEKQRPALFRLASDSDERDSTGISEILKTNDEVIQVMSLYDSIINKTGKSSLEKTGVNTNVGSLLNIDSNKNGDLTKQKERGQPTTTTHYSLLDEQLLTLGLDEQPNSNFNSLSEIYSAEKTTNNEENQPSHLLELSDIFGFISSSNQTNGPQIQSAMSNPTYSNSFSNSLNSDSNGPSTKMSSLLTATDLAQLYASKTKSENILAVDKNILSTSSSGNISNNNIPKSFVAIISTSQVLYPLQQQSQLKGNETLLGTHNNLLLAKSGEQQKPCYSSALLDLDNGYTNSKLTKASSTNLNSRSTNQTIGLNSSTKTGQVASTNKSTGFDSLIKLSQSVFEDVLSQSGIKTEIPNTKVPMNQIIKTKANNDSLQTSPLHAATNHRCFQNLIGLQSSDNGLILSNSNRLIGDTDTLNIEMKDVIEKKTEVESLEGVVFELENFTLGNTDPMVLLEKAGLKIVLNFGFDKPRSDVTVIAVATTSTCKRPIKNYNLSVEVCNKVGLKLLPKSGTDLNAYNPILPPPAITQVMLIANPNKEKVQLVYKLTYSLEGREIEEKGIVEDLPI